MLIIIFIEKRFNSNLITFNVCERISPLVIIYVLLVYYLLGIKLYILKIVYLINLGVFNGILTIRSCFGANDIIRFNHCIYSRAYFAEWYTNYAVLSDIRSPGGM